MKKSLLTTVIATVFAFNHMVAAIVYIDTVEPGGPWTTIFGGFYETGASGLTPTAGANYLAAVSANNNARGFYQAQLDDLTFEAGIYTVTFDMGVRNNFAFADRQAPIIGLTGNLNTVGNIPADNGTRLITELDSAIAATLNMPYPGVPNELMNAGWETWTLVYEIESGSPVIGQQVGFFAKIFIGDGGNMDKGYAFDNFAVAYQIPEPRTTALALGLAAMAAAVLYRRRRK